MWHPRSRFCRERAAPQTAVQLMATVEDPGPARHVFVSAGRSRSAASLTGRSDGGPTFTLDRSGAPNAVYVVTLSVTDDDLGTGSLSTAVLVGTPYPDHIVVTDDAFTDRRA